jgi:hypothetical protein
MYPTFSFTFVGDYGNEPLKLCMRSLCIRLAYIINIPSNYVQNILIANIYKPFGGSSQ